MRRFLAGMAFFALLLPSPFVLHGKASWYDTVPRGHGFAAAAGPALRRALGTSWRGKTVTVRANGRSIRVVVSDWCRCYKGTAMERLIDLDVRAFALLDSPTRGIVNVEVYP